MTWSQRIYDAFGPDVTGRDVAAALWWFTPQELESILERAKTDIRTACSEFLSAREEVDKQFGPNWRCVETDKYYDKDLNREFERAGYARGEDLYSIYWIVRDAV
jgi:hypothetical protein